MDSPVPVYSPTEANRDIIVSNLAQFLDPGAMRVLTTASSGYESSVSKIPTRLVEKRRVEAIVGEELNLAGSNQHNWSLTYKILTSNEQPTLYYTGSNIDMYVAQRMGVIKPTSVDEFAYLAQEAAKNGDVEIFNILSASSEYQMSDNNYRSFVHTAVIHDHVGILDTPIMIETMSEMSESEVDFILGDVIKFRPSPWTIDFFLTNVAYDASADKHPNHVHDAIIAGMFSFLLVLMKNNMLDPTVELNRPGLDDENWTPIWLAVNRGSVDIVKLFLDAPAVYMVDSDIVEGAIQGGRVNVVRLLLESGKVEMDNDHIVGAVSSGSIDMAKLFLSLPNLDLSSIENACIKDTVNNNRTEIALLLLKDPRMRITQQEKGALIATAKYYENSTLERALRLFG